MSINPGRDKISLRVYFTGVLRGGISFAYADNLSVFDNDTAVLYNSIGVTSLPLNILTRFNFIQLRYCLFIMANHLYLFSVSVSARDAEPASRKIMKLLCFLSAVAGIRLVTSFSSVSFIALALTL
jgi:hypothetical protein